VEKLIASQKKSSKVINHDISGLLDECEQTYVSNKKNLQFTAEKNKFPAIMKFVLEKNGFKIRLQDYQDVLKTNSVTLSNTQKKIIARSIEKQNI